LVARHRTLPRVDFQRMRQEVDAYLGEDRIGEDPLDLSDD
jgi:hypothetical protein